MAKKKPAEAENESSPEEKKPPTSSSAKTYDGAAIKKAREAKGLSHADLESRTKITAKILRALEEERYADMPNARVYVRGFVRCIAREVGLDQDAVSSSYVPRWEAWRESQAEP